MGSSRTLQKPVYAHHRLLMELMKINHGDKYAPTPEELDRVSKVFSKLGGSWYRLYHGSVDDMTRLRKVLGAVVKKGLVTKAPNWGA